MSSDRIIPETGIVDRFTGREADEFSINDNLSVQERVSRFEGAEVELLRAEAYLERGADQVDAYGDIRDVKDAIAVLRDSAEFHANGFSKEELEKAAEEKTVDVAILQAISERRTVDKKPRENSSITQRIQSMSEERHPDQSRDVDRDQER